MSLAFEHGDLTLVYPIVRSTPAVLPFIAVPLLGERISAIGGAGIATVVGGLWLVQLGRGVRRQAFAEAAARQTSVVFALVLGVFWLRETPSRMRVLGGIATVIGVALIARGS